MDNQSDFQTFVWGVKIKLEGIGGEDGLGQLD